MIYQKATEINKCAYKTEHMMQVVRKSVTYTHETARCMICKKREATAKIE